MYWPLRRIYFCAPHFFRKSGNLILGIRVSCVFQQDRVFQDGIFLNNLLYSGSRLVPPRLATLPFPRNKRSASASFRMFGVLTFTLTPICGTEDGGLSRGRLLEIFRDHQCVLAIPSFTLIYTHFFKWESHHFFRPAAGGRRRL